MKGIAIQVLIHTTSMLLAVFVLFLLLKLSVKAKGDCGCGCGGGAGCGSTAAKPGTQAPQLFIEDVNFNRY